MALQQKWPADKVERWPSAAGQVAASIQEWGWTNLVLIGEDGGIIAGHCRVLAGKKLGHQNEEIMPTDQCPYAKSDMTPCVLKDGAVCFAMDSRDRPICVGCEKSPNELGVKTPANWDMIVAGYYAKKGAGSR